MKRILFVDDEPMVLKALGRMLHGMRNEWQVQFAGSGAEALQIMAAAPADVVISDMRMPGMNGAELLNEIMQRHPQTIRLILSGYADMEMTMQCVGGTHQFLTKPCNGEVLRSVIRHTMDMDHRLDNSPVKTLVASMTNIPGLPTIYFQILKALRSPDGSLADVGETIAQDPAMTAKILQLANSAFFGVRQQIADPTAAVMHLGLETIKSLVLSMHVFAGLESGPLAKSLIEQIYQHSLDTARMARSIARLENQPTTLVDESFTAGLLHDIGRLVLAANIPDKYGEIIARHEKEGVSLTDAERAAFGASHAEVGGYLLCLWGLPVSIIETVAFHHCPGECPTKSFSSLTAVHVADALEHHQAVRAPAVPPPGLAEPYLRSVGVWERIPGWQESLKNHEPE